MNSYLVAEAIPAAPVSIAAIVGKSNRRPVIVKIGAASIGTAAAVIRRRRRIGDVGIAAAAQRRRAVIIGTDRQESLPAARGGDGGGIPEPEAEQGFGREDRRPAACQQDHGDSGCRTGTRADASTNSTV